METKVPIIILEDDIFFGKMVENFLKNHDYPNVRLFHNEWDCINSIEPLKPTVVILDHNLEHTTGFEVMDEIKQKNSKAVFIYLSGQEYCHVALKAIQLGAIDYIEKDSASFSNLKKLIDKIGRETDSFKHLGKLKTKSFQLGIQ